MPEVKFFACLDLDPICPNRAGHSLNFRIFLCLEAIAPALVSLQETMAHVKGRIAFRRPLASQVSKLVVQRELMGREFLPYNYR